MQDYLVAVTVPVVFAIKAETAEDAAEQAKGNAYRLQLALSPVGVEMAPMVLSVGSKEEEDRRQRQCV